MRMLDLTSVMEDRDIGEMYLNFEPHSQVMKYVGVDLAPLKFTKEECAHRWLQWFKTPMGFTSSPYNAGQDLKGNNEKILGSPGDKVAFSY